MEDMEAKMDFSAVVKERFSCKKFDAEKKLSKGLVEKILESGRLGRSMRAKSIQYDVGDKIFVVAKRSRFNLLLHEKSLSAAFRHCRRLA